MASASSSSAKNLFSESKRRLADRVSVNVNNATSVVRQVSRGSKSSDIIMQSAKNFAQTESLMGNSLQNLKKLELIRTHIGYQYDAMYDASEKIEYLKEQVNAMER